MSGFFGPWTNSVSSASGSGSVSTPVSPTTITHVTGDDALVYIQNIPSSVWNITHAFPRIPNVAVYDSTGRQVYPDISVVNSVTIRATFNGASDGTAILT